MSRTRTRPSRATSPTASLATSPATSTGREHAAIALASAAVVLYEIAITRILSVALWYHFAFLAVSLAMLGLGVPGVWFALRGFGARALDRALVASAVTVPLSLVVLLRFGGPLPMRAAIATLCIVVPMLALGSAVCVLLLRAPGRAIGRRYAADLLGATAAAISVVPLMHVLPTPAIVAGSAVFPALALVVTRRVKLGVLLLVGVVLLAGWREPFRVRHGKVYSEESLELKYERWTPTARLTVFETPAQRRAFGWGFGSRFVPGRVEQVWLEQDGSAGTPITRANVEPGAQDYLFFDVTNLAHQLRTISSVCVIGAGGGRDVLAALAAGARTVDAVEMNPYIVRLLSREFAEYAGDIYHRPGVRAVVSEGRSFLTRTHDTYDLIQISLIDSWAATAAGAYALSENYLYTVEAYRLYWKRLSPSGMISTSRWTADFESVRLANLAREALIREGVANPDSHIAVAEAGQVATVIASREPFVGAIRDSLAAVCERRGFVLRFPSSATDPRSSEIQRALREGPASFRARGLDVSAPIDDRPFFFHNLAVFGTAKPSDAASIVSNAQAVVVLRNLMGIVSALALILFFSPFVLRGTLPRGPGFWRGSTYFAAIGLAFMLVEIPLIQRMVLYLGHPSHAVTVVLGSMLLGASIGAALSGKLSGSRILAWGAGLVVVLAAVNLSLDGWFHSTIGWPWLARMFASVWIAGAMGLFMGCALPLGMIRFGDRGRPWYWAINGASSVVASVCSLGLAMTFGFQSVLWSGVALYVLAVALLRGNAIEDGNTARP